LRALAKTPADRFQTAEEMHLALQNLTSSADEPKTLRQTRLVEMRSVDRHARAISPRVVLCVVASVLSIAAAVGLSMSLSMPERTSAVASADAMPRQSTAETAVSASAVTQQATPAVDWVASNDLPTATAAIIDTASQVVSGDIPTDLPAEHHRAKRYAPPVEKRPPTVSAAVPVDVGSSAAHSASNPTRGWSIRK
jgi:hypothetical protein